MYTAFYLAVLAAALALGVAFIQYSQPTSTSRAIGERTTEMKDPRPGSDPASASAVAPVSLSTP